MRISIKILLAFAILNISLCWWDTGHMLVAKVAELDLKAKSKIC